MKYTLIVLVSLIYNCAYSQSVNIEKYLPKNYVTNGSVDYTVHVQKALDENKEVLFPNFPILINQNGLRINSNQVISFLERSRLIMIPNSEERYGLLNIINAKNVTVNNPVLIGDREKHVGKTGEWGMGINILSSKQVTINNAKISKFWGDGIYIGEIDYKERKHYNLGTYYSENIKIVGGIVDNNRRNGISIISVKNLLLKDMVIQNTEGTLPMAGIDIEPNNNEQFLENIRIQNVTTKNNAEIGIKYVPNNFFGHRMKNVGIRIEDSKDIGSKVGLQIGGILYSKKNSLKEIQVFNGEFVIERFSSIGNKEPLKAGSIQDYNPKITIKSFSVYDERNNELNFKNRLRSTFKSRRVKIQ